eukprot:TRINITY_DN32748_c0_g2_i1.p1 TRINITY_DN32748_c0_g2~~TRINITY_DN32748_c0_g2_i1.p1  ORF type:complete len:313 (+),score=42.88 TRINITY_DN32748_c0_g2_i1:104-1042(+)
MPEYIVVKCFSCRIHQGIQVNKKRKYSCKLCGASQCVKAVIASTDDTRELRGLVQELNMRLEAEDSRRREISIGKLSRASLSESLLKVDAEAPRHSRTGVATVVNDVGHVSMPKIASVDDCGSAPPAKRAVTDSVWSKDRVCQSSPVLTSAREVRRVADSTNWASWACDPPSSGFSQDDGVYEVKKNAEENEGAFPEVCGAEGWAGSAAAIAYGGNCSHGSVCRKSADSAVSPHNGAHKAYQTAHEDGMPTSACTSAEAPRMARPCASSRHCAFAPTASPSAIMALENASCSIVCVDGTGNGGSRWSRFIGT